MVRNAIWKKAGMEPRGGCLCIGCLERRLGRKLKPKDFLSGQSTERREPSAYFGGGNTGTSR